MTGSRLAVQVRRLLGPGRERGAELSLGYTSASAFEQVTRERVDAIRGQLDRLELKLNGVFLALVGAVVAEIYRAVVR